MKAVHLVLHLPLLVAALIVVVFSSDIELFAPLKTESTFGYWLVVGVPAAALLVVAQVILWIVWVGRRKRARAGS